MLGTSVVFLLRIPDEARGVYFIRGIKERVTIYRQVKR